MSNEKILILDYSTDQSETPAIKRWLPSASMVDALFINTEASFPDDLIQNDYTHIIHTGSALSVTKPAPFTSKAMAYVLSAREKGLAQMGICYGHQLVCMALIGRNAVRASPNGMEAGWGKVRFDDNAQKLLGVGESEFIWQHHFDEVIELPPGSQLLATNPHTEIQAYVNFENRLFGTQFHPEFDRESGNQIFIRDKDLLETNNYDLETIIKSGPSIESGKIFFGFFLEHV